MREFRCKYGLYHHKPVDSAKNPSSDNGWIYTAMAKKLKLPIPGEELQKLFKRCVDKDGELIRLPGLYTPPISRDEIIGMASLKCLNNTKFFSKNWRFHLQNYKVSLFKQIQAVLSLKGKHRNYVWKAGIIDAYPIVFRLAPHDIYYLKRMWGLEYTLFELISFYIYVAVTIYNSDSAELNLLWVQLKDLKMYQLFLFIDIEKHMHNVFPYDHPFREVFNP